MKETYGWSDGDEVAVPALTFPATINVVLQSNLKPFFVDVGMYDYLMNPSNLERRIQTAHTKLVAMMPVHLFGQSCGNELYEMAKKYRLKVLEDSCETILNPVRGDVSCHSTYMAHHVTTGVGGFAVTNDNHLNLLIRSYANHGRNEMYLPGYKSLGMGLDLIKRRFRFDRVGYSCRGTEFEAVLGLSQMDGLMESLFKRRVIAGELYYTLTEFPDLVLPIAHQDHTWMMFPIMLKYDSRIDKHRLCLHLEKHGIETRDMMPITNQPCYKSIVNENEFSVAQDVNRRGFYIPCHPGLSGKDIRNIKKAFSAYLTK